MGCTDIGMKNQKFVAKTQKRFISLLALNSERGSESRELAKCVFGQYAPISTEISSKKIIVF